MSQQLTSVRNFNPDNIIFSDPIEGSVPSSNDGPSFKYKRVLISVRHPDDSIGDLIIPTDRLYSFGIQENCAMGTTVVNGYSISLCLYGRDGPNEHERNTVETLDKILEKCKEYIFDYQGELGKEYNSIEDQSLRSLSLYYRKKREVEVEITNEKTGKVTKTKKKEIDPDSNPIMYPKLLISKKEGDLKIISRFYNAVTDEPMNALDLLKQNCYATSAIKIESIFVGKDVSIQVKVMEAQIELISSAPTRRLLPRLAADTTVRSSNSVNPMLDEVKTARPTPTQLTSSTKANSGGSLNNSEDEEEVSMTVAPSPAPEKKATPVAKKIPLPSKKASASK
jgi:hypothetical protein